MADLVRFSVFDHARDGVPKPRAMTWDEFVSGLGPTHRTGSEPRSFPDAVSRADIPRD